MQTQVMTCDQLEAFLRNVIGLVIRKYMVARPDQISAEFFHVDVDAIDEDDAAFSSVDLILTGVGDSARLFLDAVAAQCKLDGVTLTDGWADSDEGHVELTVQSLAK